MKFSALILILAFFEAHAQCPNPPGNQTSYGINSWIGYVYASDNSNNFPTAAFSKTYRGYINASETFNNNLGTNALSGANVCGTYSNQFAIRFKMQKTLAAGTYTFTVGGDDGYRLSLDGGSSFVINNWDDHNYETSTYTVQLSGTIKFVLEYYENNGDSQVSFGYSACMNSSTAPNSISGTASLCYGTGGTTLSATGGYAAPNSTYEWGTGTVGTNVISNQSNSNMYINPATTTTYWVRRVDGVPCNTKTDAATQTITVASASTAPETISGGGTICTTDGSVTLTALGGIASPGSTYRWGTGYSVGSNTIAGTGASITVSPTTQTVYWVQRINPAPCNTQTQGPTIVVRVPSTAPTSITAGTTTLCPGGGGTTLTANGGTTGSNGLYQWGTGTVGTNVISNQSNSNMYINPTETTTYWVRRIDSAPCNTATGGASITITYKLPSTQPTSILAPANSCSGSTITLSARGGNAIPGAVYQWGTGYSVGSGIIAGTTDTIDVTLSASTVYWVRIIDANPCATPSWMWGPTVSVTATSASTAPSTITAGAATICPGSATTLTASGGTHASGAVYEWGLGSVVGTTPIAGQTNNNITVSPNTTTTYWVRRQNACGTYSSGITYTLTVRIFSTAPTGISGTATICNGSSTTLTATGGVLGSNGTYQWGTGTTIGSNTIAGNTVSITVNPTTTKAYWVRRVDSAPCAASTGGFVRNVIVTNPSTAPTAITTSASTSCSGNTVTLTASGGTAATGSSYQWGTGTSVGTNPIANQSGISIAVNPTATITYWVRRIDATPCTLNTSGITTTITIIAPPGNPAVFGNNVWNVYGYVNNDLTLATAVYAGYYTQATLGFDTQNGTNSWENTLSPSSSAGWLGCPVPDENFTMVHKRKGFPCGIYTLTMQNWDDASELYIDGVRKWACADWSGANNCSGAVGSFLLDANSEIEVRTRENNGLSNASLTLVNSNINSTAPTALIGAGTICNGTSATLIASGGTLGTTGVYQWGTGAVVGDNIISGTGASISVNPISTTIYWVRRIDTVCNVTTSAMTATVTVNALTVAGSLSTPVTEICKSTTPSAITLSGHTGNVVKWQYANNAAFTTGVTDIPTTATVLSGNTIGLLTSNRYFRAIVQSGNCAVLPTASIGIIVPETVTYANGSWNGTPTATTPVIISSNLTLNTDLNVCSCQVINTAILTVPENITLIVQNNISVDAMANILIENNGSLVQVKDDAADIGSITVKRNTTRMKALDYTYWSSPVQGWKLNQLAPNTIYYSFNPMIDNWAAHGGSTVMAPTKGYIVRAPQGWSLNNATQGIYEGVFRGVPNTGIIPVSIQKGAGTFNLIGNPYPSAIDIDLFLLDPVNSHIVNGTVYLWTHNTAISSATQGNQTYNYLANDYAKYNITGGVKTGSTAITGGVTPTGKIASGGSFFIEANTALANGTYNARFNNSMRIAGNNNQFFKNNPTVSTPNTIEKHRVWLHLSNAGGAYYETLVGYIEGATNGLDGKFDGITFPGENAVSLYSILDDTMLAIQGRTLPFDQNDVIPLGFSTTIAGSFTIGLEDFDGLFGGQLIWLVDKTNNTYHNLKEADYTFTTATGTFNSRFELRFTGMALGIDQPMRTENEVAVIKTDKHITVRSGNETIASLFVYDLSGRLLYSKKGLDTHEFDTTDFNCGTQILLVKIILADKTIVTKKIGMN